MSPMRSSCGIVVRLCSPRAAPPVAAPPEAVPEEPPPPVFVQAQSSSAARPRASRLFTWRSSEMVGPGVPEGRRDDRRRGEALQRRRISDRKFSEPQDDRRIVLRELLLDDLVIGDLT